MKYNRKVYDMSRLKSIKQHIEKCLTSKKKTELMSYCLSIQKRLRGDGCGLSGGVLIDMIITEYFKQHITGFEEYHIKDCDFKILDVSFSFKKINGKSSIALNWSKNQKANDKCFESNVCILNLKSGQWWKRKDRIEMIKSGIYFIDMDFCNENVTFLSNNKTNTLINDVNLYSMLLYAKQNGLFISLPEDAEIKEMMITNAFKK